MVRKSFIVWFVVLLAVVLCPVATIGDEEKEEGIDEWLEQGYKALDQGELNKAMNGFERVLIDDPENRRARFGLGTVYIRMEMYRSAVKILEPMTKEFPEDFSLKNNVAWLYATSGDHSIRNGPKAVNMAQDALLLAPRDYHVWNTLSEAYYICGEYEKARRSAEEALRLGQELRASAKNMRTYSKQVQKCLKASEVMSLLE